MKKIVHLSDLHFGRTDASVIKPLFKVIDQIKPDLIVISGDLTQRAKKTEFKQAKDFIKSLPCRVLIVPGNHDIPLYNVFARFFRSLHRYKQYIRNNIEPFYLDEEVCVVGINTARAKLITRGSVSSRQVKSVAEKLSKIDGNPVRIVVSHHPFDLSEEYSPRKLVKGAKKAMVKLAQSSVDIFLAGHFHRSYIGTTTKRYRIDGHNALVVQAGTATSVRQRGETFSFNVLTIGASSIDVEHYGWQLKNNAYGSRSKELYKRTKTGLIEK